MGDFLVHTEWKFNSRIDGITTFETPGIVVMSWRDPNISRLDFCTDISRLNKGVLKLSWELTGFGHIRKLSQTQIFIAYNNKERPAVYTAERSFLIFQQLIEKRKITHFKQVEQNGIVIPILGHAEEVIVEDRGTTATGPDIPGFSQREHAFDANWAGAPVFDTVGICGAAGIGR